MFESGSPLLVPRCLLACPLSMGLISDKGLAPLEPLWLGTAQLPQQVSSVTKLGVALPCLALLDFTAVHQPPSVNLQTTKRDSLVTSQLPIFLPLLPPASIPSSFRHLAGSSKCSETTTTMIQSHCKQRSSHDPSPRLAPLANPGFLCPTQLAARPDIPGRVCRRGSQAGFGRGRHSKQDTFRLGGHQGTTSASPPLSYVIILTPLPPTAQCRRTLLLPKETIPHRLACRYCHRWPRLGRARALQLHEAAVPGPPPDLRP